MRPRACGALIRDGKILMVHHVHDGKDYWTLPGGHVGEGESFEDAAIREVWEETGLNVSVTRLLWEGKAGQFQEKCFLLEEPAGEQEAKTGEDPELRKEDQILKEVAWFPLKDKADDSQVFRVVRALGLK